jgi:phage terminase large subunit-like protein
MMTSSTDFYFDEEAADRAELFFARYLVHTKGRWAGEAFALQDWQRDDIIRPLFGWKRPDGTRRYRTAYIEVPRKNGKALDVDTPVPTPDGWKRHEDLVPDDLVFDPDGNPTKVLAVTEAYIGECYTVKFSDNTSIIAHANHEWVTERSWFTKRARGSRAKLPVVTTAEIKETLRCGKRGDLVHRVPVAAPLNLRERNLLVDPYALGVWLGDGATAGARLTCADEDILTELVRRGYTVEPYSKQYSYLIGRGHFQIELRRIGVLGNKHIPHEYLRSSYRQRLDLLRGLLDTDGYVTKRGQCELVLTNHKLFWDAVELIRSLGHKPTISIDRAKLNGKDCGPRYRARFCGYADEPVVLMQRKAARLKAKPKDRTRAHTRQIVSVEPVGERLVNCIQVQGGIYLAGDAMVPTHNSTLASGIALYLLLADREAGAEVYSAASDRDQAAIVFNQARAMVEESPSLLRRVEPYRNSLVVTATRSFYRVLSAEAYSKHGLNAHGIVFDELHAQPDRELWDVLTTSTGSRSQPLVVAITTAGYDRESICWEQHEYARQVNAGIINDDSFLGVIYAADEGDDWQDSAVWHKANPGLGVTVSVDYLAQECERAKNVPAYQNTFRRLHLNQWTSQDVRWLPMTDWDACGEALPDLAGRECYGGLDMASTTDVAAFVMVFPPKADSEPWYILPRFYVPAENIIERARRDRVPYDAWARDGWITATEGNVIDFATIRADIEALGEVYNIREIAFDRWGAMQISQDLSGAGFTMVPFGQGFASMSAPTKELLRLVLERRIAHGGNPVLRWMADNLMVRQDPAGNVKPDKGKSREKIDGLVAAIMGLDRGIRNETGPSVYETRGILSL